MCLSAGLLDYGVPIIDLQLDSRGTGRSRDQIVEEIRKATLKAPYFLVTNHGIPESSFTALWKAQESFFSQPQETKRQVAFDADRCGPTLPSSQPLIILGPFL